MAEGADWDWAGMLGSKAGGVGAGVPRLADVRVLLVDVAAAVGVGGTECVVASPVTPPRGASVGAIIEALGSLCTAVVGAVDSVGGRRGAESHGA